MNYVISFLHCLSCFLMHFFNESDLFSLVTRYDMGALLVNQNGTRRGPMPLVARHNRGRK